ncbi:hypothetical protein I8748_27470 [Nostoc sp. CENA67]|uniref:Uncharacterized protein n=1 Tax=Amazonocrinis nigriterrae CENA67 TaxID=2794033 RepID=A0A8J7HYM0_9NOST|nr:hypothetical protein [Amazonocrinis nigriterrae]MBH8565863.1 hypothetical protein [Amazonocrinis nigriterrae CENA67]
MKRILLGTLLALPFAISSFPSQASAAQIIAKPNVHKVAVVRKPVVRYQRKLIPAHWETVRRGNNWVRIRVPARYVNVRV